MVLHKAVTGSAIILNEVFAGQREPVCKFKQRDDAVQRSCDERRQLNLTPSNIQATGGKKQ